MLVKCPFMLCLIPATFLDLLHVNDLCPFTTQYPQLFRFHGWWLWFSALWWGLQSVLPDDGDGLELCGCCGKVFLFLHFCWVMWLILSKKFYLTGLNMNVFSSALIILLIVLLWFPTLTSIIYDSIEIVQFKYKINRPFFDMVQNLCHNYIIC